LTFILLERPAHLPSSTHPLLSPEEIKGCRMVGDVNMFLPDGIEEEGECEIMIAGALIHTGFMELMIQKRKIDAKGSLVKH
jgi:hypothetical protein